MNAPKASYTIAELAKLMNRTRHQMRGLLKSHHVTLTRSGRAIYVLLVNLKRAWPDAWDSIENAKARARSDAED